MASRAISDLHPDLQLLAIKFLELCWNQGINVFITQTWRSWSEQDADYAKGRTTPGAIVTNARGGESPHNCTLDGTPSGVHAAKAFDFAIKGADGALDWNPSHPAWLSAIAIGQSLGLVSGSTWPHLRDYPHFELEGWKKPE